MECRADVREGTPDVFVAELATVTGPQELGIEQLSECIRSALSGLNYRMLLRLSDASYNATRNLPSGSHIAVRYSGHPRICPSANQIANLRCN